MAETMVAERTPKSGIWGWMLFDWAAQPFFTVVTTFIFGPYFVARMATDPAIGQAAWGYGIAAAGFVIAILSPVLGSIADQTGPRKPWIAFFAAIKIVCLCMLWFAAPGSPLVPVVLFFSLASVAAEFSIVFNDSMMPRLVPKEEIGKISNVAWGLGYLGGMIVLIFVVAFLAGVARDRQDHHRRRAAVRPRSASLARTPAPPARSRRSGTSSSSCRCSSSPPMAARAWRSARPCATGSAELRSTLGEVRKRSGIFRFLVARMIYQDGVNALLALGGAFAAAMFGWSITEIGIYGIILNVVAIFGCLVRKPPRHDARLEVGGADCRWCC